MQFVCRIGTPEGRVLEDVFTASDELALRSELGKRGYHVFEIRRRGLPKALTGKASASRGRKRIPDTEFLVFNQELAALLKAGLPLLQALDLMLERMSNLHFKGVLTDVRDRLKSGEDLSDAFAAYSDIVPRLYPSSLKAGEKSGEMEKVIRRFVRYMKLVLDARRRVISALIYPIVLVCLSITMIAVMTIYVVPKFMVFFDQLDAELPLITRVLLSISAFAQKNSVLLLVVVVAAVIGWRSWSRTEAGRLTIDGLKLRLPLLGGVLHRFAIAEFCRSVSTLLSGGIPLVPAFEIGSSAIGNGEIRRRVEPQVQLVREGKPFHTALEKSEAFTDMAIDMVKVGEATGALDEMLSSVADFMDEQIETRMQRILSLVEPLMLVFMGMIIAIILIAIYLPLFSVLGKSNF